MVQGDKDLPAGWESAIDQATGVPYYYNRKTRVTQWERPEAPKAMKLSVKNEGGSATAEDKKVGGLIYLWVGEEKNYGGDNFDGTHFFTDKNSYALGADRKAPVEGFKGLMYNELHTISPEEFLNDSVDKSPVPRDGNVPAVPGDHGQRAVAILLSYCTLLKHVAETKDPEKLYVLVESDQSLQADWDQRLAGAAATAPEEGDAFIMKWASPGAAVGDKGWAEATGTPPIGIWAVTGASARRILNAIKEHQIDCWDLDCMLGELHRKGAIKVLQSPGEYSMTY